METGQPDVIRVSLVRTGEQTLVPTVRVTGHTARAITPVPQGTPGIALEQSRGPSYNVFAVARLDAVALDCSPSEATEYQLIGQSQIDWVWNCVADEPGDQRIALSIEIRWEPVSGTGPAVRPSPLWTESVKIEVERPLIRSGVLQFFSMGSGLLGSVLSVPWLFQRMRNSERKKRLRVDRTDLRRMLLDHFSREELRTLCFDLDIEYENLPDTLNGMSRELVTYCERHHRLPDLLAVAKQQRPELPWPEIPTDG